MYNLIVVNLYRPVLLSGKYSLLVTLPTTCSPARLLQYQRTAADSNSITGPPCFSLCLIHIHILLISKSNQSLYNILLNLSILAIKDGLLVTSQSLNYLINAFYVCSGKINSLNIVPLYSANTPMSIGTFG